MNAQRQQLATGEGLSQLGLRQAALGETGQQFGQQQAGFLFDLGKQQQAQDQAVLEAQRQSELQQAYEPYQRVVSCQIFIRVRRSRHRLLRLLRHLQFHQPRRSLVWALAVCPQRQAHKAGLFG